MRTTKINENLILKLQATIDNEQMDKFMSRYNNQAKQILTEAQNEILAKQKISLIEIPKRITSQSKQRLLLRRKQSKKQLQEKNRQEQNNDQCRNETAQEGGCKNIIKDKAVFVNVPQIPYLHSTDLLNHLYKKSSSLLQNREQILYNPSSNNLYALTKVKHLHIYYCKIQSLRDIGTGWSNLVQLSIYFGQLKDFGGLNAFPNIEFLHCPYNSISTISDLMFHPTLISIDLQSNRIEEFSQVEHLFTIQNLQYINLLNNPIYSSKQNKRKINQKLQKILEIQYTRLQEYVKQKQNEIWQIQNSQGIQYCNSLLKQFFNKIKDDQITVETKYQFCSAKGTSQQNNFQSSQLQDNDNKDEQNKQKEFKIQYILPQIPQNSYFQDIILNGNYSQAQNQVFCEQKIVLTPLIQMVEKDKTYQGSVLRKYLHNKLLIRQQITRPKNKKINNQNTSQNNFEFKGNQIECKNQSKIKNDCQAKSKQKTSKLKKVVKSSLAEKTAVESIKNTAISQKVKEFQTTNSSLLTNCTNLNTTVNSDIPFRKSKLALSKSKQKSFNRFSLVPKIGEYLPTNETTNLQQNHLHSFSLTKQARLIGRTLKKEKKQSNNQKNQASANKFAEKCSDDIQILQKASFSTDLRRRPTLSGHKRQTSFILKRKQV